ncbi:MAG TPA: DUF1844 domain-containing protein [Terriglobia bacterium]|nr:DUF1844 domain-containing protein [Terriglobia bacterium]
MPDEKNADPGFKVVDRRPFAGDGSTREEAVKTPLEPPKAVRPAERAPANATPLPKPPRAEAPRIEVPRIEVPEAGFDDEFALEGGAEPGEGSGFETLVSYLGTTAMFQLGLMAGPGGERIPAELAHARQTIDMLEVLAHKTQGNLTADEARLLDDVLYELRLAYVEVEKRSAPRPK